MTLVRKGTCAPFQRAGGQCPVMHHRSGLPVYAYSILQKTRKKQNQSVRTHFISENI